MYIKVPWITKFETEIFKKNIHLPLEGGEIHEHMYMSVCVLVHMKAIVRVTTPKMNLQVSTGYTCWCEDPTLVFLIAEQGLLTTYTDLCLG